MGNVAFFYLINSRFNAGLLAIFHNSVLSHFFYDTPFLRRKALKDGLVPDGFVLEVTDTVAIGAFSCEPLRRNISTLSKESAKSVSSLAGAPPYGNYGDYHRWYMVFNGSSSHRDKLIMLSKSIQCHDIWHGCWLVGTPDKLRGAEYEVICFKLARHIHSIPGRPDGDFRGCGDIEVTTDAY